MSVHAAPVTSSTVSLAVDVGKSSFVWSLTDAARIRMLGPVECSMSGPALREVVACVERVLPPEAQVKVGVEAAGHYHRPLLAPTAWPAGWELLELNPAHVTEQRRVMGRRRVKTDAIDLEAITELLLAGRGVAVTTRAAVLGELTSWSAHRTRRVAIRTATKNQLLGQLDRAFPGLTLVLPDVLGTKIGRLVAAEFADPARLTALGASRLIRFAATRNLRLRRPLAERLVTAARDALPTADAAAARAVLAADLTLLGNLDAQIGAAEAELARLLPASPFATLTSVPGWGLVRAGNYGAALGDPARWPGPRQVYRAAGLSPMQYESAGRRRDGGISREGSVQLRRALIDLGMGLWLNDRSARDYAAALKARGKRGGIIACALAHRANKIAYALVRDQAPYDAARWSTRED
ncbi:IS110 family transposase [Blastococcus sp. KM273128]|uniref:IS110 family transposase n=1 Tax=Blastococcus sp. KM273128 TaxID=2570314 RepID=UPI0027DF00C9|nr:IS110 family transposase [Blastococcus sp. KM273128]MCF6744090.1 IS110 family transposase [Blastococcus sp. KM273128]